MAVELVHAHFRCSQQQTAFLWCALCILIPEDKSFKPTLRHFKTSFSSSAIGLAKQINHLDGVCSFVAVRPLHAFGHTGTRNKDNNTKHHQYQIRTICHKQNLNLV